MIGVVNLPQVVVGEATFLDAVDEEEGEAAVVPPAREVVVVEVVVD